MADNVDESNGAGVEVEDAIKEEEPKLARPQAQAPQRRIFLPDTGGAPVNVQFVSGAQAPPAKAPAKPKPSAFERAQADATDSWEQEAANLADTVIWELERIGPVIHNNKKVPCGTFPQEYTGKVTHAVIGEIAGGGKYYVKYEDPKTGKSKKIGPFNVAGDPKMRVGVIEDNDESGGVSEDGTVDFGGPPDFRVASYGRKQDTNDEWITVFDPQKGWLKRKKHDLEREGRAQQHEPMIEALKIQMQAQVEATKAQQKSEMDMLKIQMQNQADAAKRSSDELKDMFKAFLMQSAAPKDDQASKWLEIERERLQAEKTLKSEEMKYLRDKMISDREMLEAKMEAERKALEAKMEADKNTLELKLAAEKASAEARFDAERARAEADKAAAEARLEAERDRISSEKNIAEQRLADAQKSANDKLEHAHETMMSMVREKSNPMDQIGGIFNLFQQFNDAMTPDKEEDGVIKMATPKTRVDKFVDLVTSAAQRVLPALEPLAQQAVQNYMQGQQQVQQQTQPAPAQITTRAKPQAQPAQKQQKPVAAVSVASEGVVSASEEEPAPTKEELSTGIGKLLQDVSSAIDRNVAPSVTWNNLLEEQPLYATQLKAYDTPEKMAAELTAVASTPGFEKYSKVLFDVAKKITGHKKRWAEEFLAVVHRSE